MIKISNFKFQISNFQKGFTLIELLIVVAIIAILSTLLMTNFIGVRQRARDGQRKADLRQIQAALELYRADIGSYPLTSASAPANPVTPCGTSASTFQGGSPLVTYLQKIPCNPSGGSYTYSSNATTYSLVVCLENGNDSQIDKDASGNKIVCSTNSSQWQHTVTNP